jgi:uncharacterized repeat protein (TIGR01451 family)
MRRILLPLLLMPLLASGSQFSIYLDSLHFSACGFPTGQIGITAINGLAPFTFVWADGPITEDRDGLLPGTYSVTATDDTGAIATASYVVEYLPLQVVTTSAGWHPCPGEANGSVVVVNNLPNEFPPQTNYLGGVPPYWVQVYNNGSSVFQTTNDQYGNMVFTGFAVNDPCQVHVTDANGCTGDYSINVLGPLGTLATVSDVVAGCTGAGIGGQVTVHGGGEGWPMDLTIVDDQQQVVSSIGFLFGSEQRVVTGLVPGDYTMEQLMGATEFSGCAPQIIPFTIPELGGSCGSVSGSSWYDTDQDCVRDANEVGIPYSTLVIQPSGDVALTNAQGNYIFPLPDGAYNIEETDPTLVPICPVVQPAPFTVSGGNTTVQFANGSTALLDLIAAGDDEWARPGFNYDLFASVANSTPQLSGPVTVVCTLDPALTFIAADPPGTVVGQTITWTFPAFGSFHYEYLHVETNVPVGTTVGTVLNSTVTVSNTLPESDLTNNTVTFARAVVSSFDPNDKEVRTSSRFSDSQYFIDEDEYMDYTIRFQNTGNAAATFVVITDTLSDVLDMMSFQQGVASHPFSVTFKSGRVVEWRFDNIQLTDSGTNEAESHGLVSFRIKPVQPLLPGTIISNTANIFFDYNEPVITEPSVLVAEFSTGIAEQGMDIKLFPNPASNKIFLQGADHADWMISSLDGRVLATGRSTSEPGELNISALNAGAYFLHASCGQRSVTIRFQKIPAP